MHKQLYLKLNRYSYWYALWPMKNSPNFFLAVGFCLWWSCSAALGAEEFLLDLFSSEEISEGCEAFSVSGGGDRVLNLPDEDLVRILFSTGLGLLLIGEDDLETWASSYFSVS